MLQSTVSRGRRSRWRKLVPLALLAVAAAVAGIVVASRHGSPERALAQRYARAWARGDFGAMYGLLDGPSRRQLSEPAFAAGYRAAAVTATLTGVAPVRMGSYRSGAVPVVFSVRTRLFGTLRETLTMPVSGRGTAARVRYSPALVFPGLRAGERLSRRLALPPRAALLAADGTPLAQGPDRSSPVPGAARAIAGVLGPIPRGQAGRYAAEGYPPGAKVGLDGLERIFQSQLAGVAGGSLLAGRRVLANRAARPGQPVKTTIDPAIETAVDAALGGRLGGVVALDPRTGAVLGAAGVAFSGLQPPGSTMKIVTSTGLLQAGLVTLDQVFPVRTAATVGGYVLHNANGEACGGTLINAFAVSCNSVFAPLGVKLGAPRFLAVAQRYGFNQPSPIPGEPASTIPPASVRGSVVELGSSAIGQGKVQASALQMADVAATIAMRGRRPVPTLVAGRSPRSVAVTSPAVAASVQQMMEAVVDFPNGTGTAAQIPGVRVAGKTGTAELRNSANPNTSSPSDTDAWFVAYAPVGAPRIVVGALFPGQGAGGATAAPAARQVLLAGLRR
jgi:cell division protein FtsI/penicillin-binding protein 2